MTTVYKMDSREYAYMEDMNVNRNCLFDTILGYGQPDIQF